MRCCVAPAVLFMFGLMGGVYAISFADFFYNEDGATGLSTSAPHGNAVLGRGVAVVSSSRHSENRVARRAPVCEQVCSQLLPVVHLALFASPS
jgi:hypothetical protein